MDKKILIGSIMAVTILILVSTTSAVDVKKKRDNQSPSPPAVSGMSQPKLGEEYVYDFLSEDPECDNVSYYIDWGDGTIINWTDYFPSGVPIRFIHAWYSPGYIVLKAKAKDIYGAESNWTSCIFNIPFFKEIITNIRGKVTSLEVIDGFFIREVVINANNISIRGLKHLYPLGQFVYFTNNADYIHASQFIGFQHLSNCVWGIALGEIEWS